MKKQIIRIIGATAICALLSINVTSFQHLQIGVEEVNARQSNSSPCWGRSVVSLLQDYTKCNTCTTESGKPRGTELTCSSGGPGEV